MLKFYSFFILVFSLISYVWLSLLLLLFHPAFSFSSLTFSIVRTVVVVVVDLPCCWSCHIDDLTTLSILLPPSIQAVLPLNLSRVRHRCYGPSCHIDNLSTSLISPSCWSCSRHLSMLSRSLLSCGSCGGVFLGVGCVFLGGCCRLCLVVVFFFAWMVMGCVWWLCFFGWLLWALFTEAGGGWLIWVMIGWFWEVEVVYEFCSYLFILFVGKILDHYIVYNIILMCSMEEYNIWCNWIGKWYIKINKDIK